MKNYDKKYWYTSGSGKIEFELTWNQATRGSHQGDCEADVRALLEEPDIRAIFDGLDKEAIRETLAEYGCWSEQELADDAQNRLRLLWLACGDIADDPDNRKDQEESE